MTCASLVRGCSCAVSCRTPHAQPPGAEHAALGPLRPTRRRGRPRDPGLPIDDACGGSTGDRLVPRTTPAASRSSSAFRAIRFTYYVAGANGGIIKTTNGGTTFKPIFDKQDVSSIGAIAIAPSDPNVIYVGTGEGNPRNNASVGDGMYKSIDGGEHWTHIGLEKTRQDRAHRDRRAQPRHRVRVRHSGASGGLTRSAASSRRSMAASRGRRCCTSIRRPPAPTSPPIRTTRTSSTPACTPTGAGRGTSSRAAATPRSTSR